MQNSLNGIKPPDGAHPINFFDFAENLSFGVYQVNNDRKIVYCNEGMAEILGCSNKEELIGRDILDFYFYKEDRKRFINEMENEGKFHEVALHWKTDKGRHLWLSDSCQYVYDNNGNIVGMCGMVRDIWYSKLFDEMNAGIYRIGSDLETIEMVNPAVAKMFGYSSPKDLEGMSVSELYKDSKEMEKLIKKLEADPEGKVENHIIEMRKFSGEEIVISVNAALIKDQQGAKLGREGTFTDVTDSSRIRHILEEMPTGAYQIRIDEDKIRRISYCNRAFAKLFKYNKPEKLKGKDVYDLYYRQADADEFEKKLLEADMKDKPLLNHRLQVKDKDKKPFWVRIDCHLLKDHTGTVIGRQGTLRDAKIEIQLEEMIKGREDVQRFSHRLIAPIVSINSHSMALIEEVRNLLNLEIIDEPERDIFRGLKNDPFEIYKAIIRRSRYILKELFDIFEKNEVKNMKSLVWDWLRENIDEWQEIFSDNKIENIIEVREVHRKMTEFLKTYPENFLEGSHFRNELERVLMNLADLDRFYILYLAQVVVNTAYLAHVDVERLRSYLLNSDKTQEANLYDFKPANLTEVIRSVVNIYQIYAAEKSIMIEYHPGKMFVENIAKEGITQLMHYLIENAVKYSFRKLKNIIVRIHRDDAIKIEIQNCGVGILKEEIDSEKIYDYGYRGKFSNDLHRTGSGIGLAEAKYLVERHNGEISISSETYYENVNRVDENTPHITKVVVSLPILPIL
jgi:PAS domain S-box-containing protein